MSVVEPLDPRGTAHHEVAHAIAALSFGQPVAMVSLVDEGGGGKYRACEPEPAMAEWLADEGNAKRLFDALVGSMGPKDCESAWPRLVIGLVGRAAQRRVGVGDEGCDDDVAKAHAVAAAVTSSEREASILIAMAERAAEQIVLEKWSSIESVASVLLVRRRLTGAELSEIVSAGRAGARRRAWDAIAARVGGMTLAPRGM
jgi:hypothetical protein